MDPLRENLLKVQTELIYAVMTGAMRLPNPALAKVLSTARSASLLTGAPLDNDFIKHLLEIETYFAEGSELGEAMRRMILDARPSQVKSIIRGYLINYIYDW